MKTMITDLHKLVIRHEGLKLKPYYDTVHKLTIGAGRNLDDKGITADEALMLLDNDIREKTARVREIVPSFDSLSFPRQWALIDMSFMGPEKLKGFTGMLAAIEAKDWAAVSREMLDSRWAEEVGVRATELASIMQNDKVELE